MGPPKGINQVLEERGNNTTHVVAKDMIALSWHNDDFQNKKMIIEHYLNGRGQLVMVILKFHCELSSIE